jgi:hypothetical protein
MFHTVDTRRYRGISLLGLLFILLVILASVAVNQSGLHQTHAASACPEPPAGFDATAPNVTNAQLERYGLPARPSASKQPREYATWLNLVRHDKHRICTTSTGGKMAFSGTSAVSPLSMKSANVEYFNFASGYTATGSGIGYVTGTWEVPCPQDGHVTATLQNLVQVGFPSTLLAIGTQENHTQSSVGNYGTDKDQYVVYFQGQGGSLANPIDYPIHCGDAVSAQIVYDNSGGTPQWNAYVGDTSTNSSFSMTYTAGGLPNNAFWGEYTPAYPLYDFGTVTWQGNELANSSNQNDSRPIAQWPNSAVQMQDSHRSGLAYPSGLDSAGTSYTDYWQNSY